MNQTNNIIAFLKNQNADQKSARERTKLATEVKQKHHRKPFHAEWHAAGVALSEVGKHDFEPDYRPAPVRRATRH